MSSAQHVEVQYLQNVSKPLEKQICERKEKDKEYERQCHQQLCKLHGGANESMTAAVLVCVA